MATTWNPADITSGLVLSATNHVATNPSNGNRGARATTSKSSGKWYFEITNIVYAAGGDGALGIANSTYNYASISPDATNAALLVQPSGTAATNSAGTAGTVTLGTQNAHRLGVAVDFDNQKIWFRTDGGNWNNNASADPATGTLYRGIGAIGSAFPVCRFQNTNDSARLNAGDTTFIDPVPSGFTAWDSTPPPPTTARAMIIG